MNTFNGGDHIIELNSSTLGINELDNELNVFKTDTDTDGNNSHAEDNKENAVIDDHACNKDIAIKKVIHCTYVYLFETSHSD